MLNALQSMSRRKLSRWLAYGEDALYLAAGAMLAATAAVILYTTARLFFEALRAGDVMGQSVAILDAILLVLLIVEIMHTIRVSIVEHRFLAEPFLVVALIAGVRRVLILLVEASEFLPSQPEMFERVLLEMGVLIAFFVVIVGSLVVLKRANRAEAATRAAGGTRPGTLPEVRGGGPHDDRGTNDDPRP